MTVEERERRAEEYFQRITEVNKENALMDMRTSISLFLTKNGKYESFDDFMAKHKSEGFNTKQPKAEKSEARPENSVVNQKEARRKAAADRLRRQGSV